jgi:hypothetical protein
MLCLDCSRLPSPTCLPVKSRLQFVQALGMFFGECLCMVAFRYTLYREKAENRVVEVNVSFRLCAQND